MTIAQVLSLRLYQVSYLGASSARSTVHVYISSNSRSVGFFCLQPSLLRWIHFSKSPGHLINWNPLHSFVSIDPFDESLVGHYHMWMAAGIRMDAGKRNKSHVSFVQQWKVREAGSDVPHGEDEIVVFSVKVLKPLFPNLDDGVGILPAAAVGHVLHECQRDEI